MGVLVQKFPNFFPQRTGKMTQSRHKIKCDPLRHITHAHDCGFNVILQCLPPSSALLWPPPFLSCPSLSIKVYFLAGLSVKRPAWLAFFSPVSLCLRPAGQSASLSGCRVSRSCCPCSICTQIVLGGVKSCFLF